MQNAAPQLYPIHQQQLPPLPSSGLTFGGNILRPIGLTQLPHMSTSGLLPVGPPRSSWNGVSHPQSLITAGAAIKHSNDGMGLGSSHGHGSSASLMPIQVGQTRMSIETSDSGSVASSTESIRASGASSGSHSTNGSRVTGDPSASGYGSTRSRLTPVDERSPKRRTRLRAATVVWRATPKR